MSDSTIDLDAYLRRIGFAGTPTATLQTLTQLVECQSGAIPFENIDVLAGRVPRLDGDSLQRKLVHSQRGGYCFEQNQLLLGVLRQIGFDASGLEARVRAGVPADVVTGRTHMALRVCIDGRHYLADVGFGHLAPTLPLDLARRDAQHGPRGSYRIVEMGSDLMLQALTREGWADTYRIAPTAPQPIDYEMGNWWVATHPKAMLRHNLLVARAVPGGRLMLFNHQLTMRRSTDAAPELRELHTRGDFAATLTDDFGLSIDGSDLDAVMAALERQTAG